MRKLIILVLALMVVVLLTPQHSDAEGATECRRSREAQGAFDCSGSGGSSQSGTSASHGDGVPIRRPTAQGIVDPQVLQARDLIAKGEDPPQDLLNAICTGNAPMAQTRDLCWVDTPGVGAAEPTPAEQARATAYDYFRRLPLPKPNPLMSSIKGICGVKHSLDLQMPAEKVFQIATPQGTLTLHAYATIYVNWGDKDHNVYRSTGAPWPNSALAHEWTTKGYYDIDALVSWTADWSIPGIASGQVGGAYTRATINRWPVIEAQAVLVD